MTNTITKARALIVRACKSRRLPLSRKDIFISEVTIIPAQNQAENIKIIKGSMRTPMDDAPKKFSYLAAEDKLLIQDNLLGGL